MAFGSTAKSRYEKRCYYYRGPSREWNSVCGWCLRRRIEYTLPIHTSRRLTIYWNVVFHLSRRMASDRWFYLLLLSLSVIHALRVWLRDYSRNYLYMFAIALDWLVLIDSTISKNINIAILEKYATNSDWSCKIHRLTIWNWDSMRISSYSSSSSSVATDMRIKTIDMFLIARQPKFARQA